MKCPKCGGDIPFYDIKPNCRHCGVNILYYSQDYELSRDAKRTELENAAGRMILARIKAVFIGSPLAITRMVVLLLAICALMIPFGTAAFHLPFYEETLSVGLIGVIQSFSGGLLPALPAYLHSALFAQTSLGAAIVLAFFAVLTVIDAVMLIMFLLGFLQPEQSAKRLKVISIIACAVSLGAQIAALLGRFLIAAPAAHAAFLAGFGAIVCFALHLALVILNSVMLKKGITPAYREFDPKRRELLLQFRKGEIDLDDLPLPVFESEEEYNTRMSEFRHAMQEEATAEMEAAAAHAKEEGDAK